MIDIKKLDKKDIVFLNKETTKEEDLAFSKFLQDRKFKKGKKTIKAKKVKV